MVDPESEVIVAAEGDEHARRLARMLEAVGFRHIRGYLEGGISAWRAAGLKVQTIPALDIPGLAGLLRNEEVVVLDVRSVEEWRARHVEGSIHVPYQRLRDGVPQEARKTDGRPRAVICGSGVRSALAASLLGRAGVNNVEHVAEGGVPDLAGEKVELVEGD